MEENSNILLVHKSLKFNSQQSYHRKIWLLSQNLVEMGHDVTILWEGDHSGCENSYIKEGVMLTELPFFSLGKLNLQLNEIMFNISALKWIKKNGHEFNIIQILGKTSSLHKYEYQNESINQTIKGLRIDKQYKNGYSKSNLLYSMKSAFFKSKMTKTSPSHISWYQDIIT